jgi:hypothetical protein
VIQRREGSVETRVVIEDCPGAVNVEWRAKFFGDACKINIFAVKFAVAVVKKMHESL